MTNKKTLIQPVSADSAARAFREQSSENERLYLEAEARASWANRMKLLRIEAKLSQLELAERIGAKQPFIARLERGGYDRCEISTLRTILQALGRDFNFDMMTKPLAAPKFNGHSSCSALEAQFEHDAEHQRQLEILSAIRWATEEGDVLMATACVSELKDRRVAAAA